MEFKTVFFTVLSGVLVYIIGQIINKFYIEPIQRQKETIGKISDALIYYSNLYTSPKISATQEFDRPEKREKAHEDFRNLACELVSRTHQIPHYIYLSYLKIVPKEKIIIISRGNLIGLSNGMWPSYESMQHNIKFQKELETNLDLLTE
jgi:hypothetical protein